MRVSKSISFKWYFERSALKLAVYFVSVREREDSGKCFAWKAQSIRNEWLSNTHHQWFFPVEMWDVCGAKVVARGHRACATETIRWKHSSLHKSLILSFPFACVSLYPRYSHVSAVSIHNIGSRVVFFCPFFNINHKFALQFGCSVCIIRRL